ncbi:alpha-L-arabinofuranosidase C-terminal domain-containing protein [Massiliimalia timonensis]|uniref:alpha-L-arabinofuranosidase C-terminal domain-containing protein n=1 Tax=Massiliimalia timonensis TaxID=1987501 RepID=UPI001E49D78A|nr:alpha-L-arabinofuranosidase C-terminal domain-containing protein [Massiliimalia timonensis]
MELRFDKKKKIGLRDPKLFGQFIEHFHRCVYGGVYDPASSFADEQGLRKDVIEALNRIGVPVIRWPGGCFVSGYHWQDGIGPKRIPCFDKAWKVEESNLFGTAEFLDFCRKIHAQPYICCNAGTGTEEEMSDWVEYCNQTQGKWARLRREHGYEEPFHVKYWSIGNENYFDGELGSRNPKEWARLVSRASHMMKRADDRIELLAPCANNLEWNLRLLAEAGHRLNWLSVHSYDDMLQQVNEPSSYEQCILWLDNVKERIEQAESAIHLMGYRNKIHIAIDEWNLRGWHHPNVDVPGADYLTPRDKNDDNSTYTMADAVYTACYLNECFRHCNSVKMANYAPTVNGRGLIYTHDDGIVLRPTYFVFDLYANLLGDEILDSWFDQENRFALSVNGKEQNVSWIDAVPTMQNGRLRIALVNKHPEEACRVFFASSAGELELFTLNGKSKDSYNDIDHPETVRVEREILKTKASQKEIYLPPHSVTIVREL